MRRKNVVCIHKIQICMKYPLKWFWRFHENSSWPHASLLCFLSSRKNIIEFKQVPCSKKDRIYVCVLKCRIYILLRSRKRRLFRLSCCWDHCRCKKERLALFVIQNLNELEVVCLFTTKLVDANLAHIRIDYS